MIRTWESQRFREKCSPRQEREKKRTIKKSSCSCYSGSGGRKQGGSNTEEDEIPYPLSSLLRRLGSWSFSLWVVPADELSQSLSLLFPLLSLKGPSFIFIVHQTEREGRRNTPFFFFLFNYKRKQRIYKDIVKFKIWKLMFLNVDNTKLYFIFI